MRHLECVALVVLAALVAACEPETITEARDQLDRGGVRTVMFSLPIANDTLTIAQFLPEDETVTTSSGLIGVTVDTQMVTIRVGEELEFEDLTFDTFTFSYDQMLQTQEDSISVSIFAALLSIPADSLRFATDSGSNVVSATVDSGFVFRRIDNNTSCDVTVNLALNDTLANNIVVFPPASVAANVINVVDTVDLAGKTFVAFVEADLSGTSFGACVPGAGESVLNVLTFGPLKLSAVQLKNVNEPFEETYGALDSESRIQAVDTVVAESGSFVVTAENRIPIQIDVDIEVAGIFKNGANLSGTLVLPAAPGDGSTVTGTLTLPLSGDTIVPSQVVGIVDGSAIASQATVTSVTATDAVIVNALGNVVVASMTGSLDPATTPELSVSVESSQEVNNDDFAFDDFEDVIRDATLNDATASLILTNTADIPVVLESDFVLGAARLDPLTGDVVRDALGDPVFEVDSAGTPILIPVVDPGMTTLSIGRDTTTKVELDVAPLADRVVKLALDDVRVALVTTGTATAGDGSRSTIVRSDVVDVDIGFVVGLDLTLPANGVTFSVSEVESGGELDPDDADAVAGKLVNATITSEVINGTPFEVVVEFAYVAGDKGDTTDVFLDPDRVVLNTVSVDAPNVDANGLVTQPISDATVLTVDSAQVRGLLGESITTTVRIRLLPASGGGGRGAVRATDEIVIRARAEIELRGGT